MLAIAEICPNCGNSLSRHRRAGIPSGRAGDCPFVAFGAFPFIAPTAESSLEYDEATTPVEPSTPSNGYPSSTGETASGLHAAPIAAPGRPSRRSDLLAMTWGVTHGSEDFI